jgi:hypothetical protein
MFVRDTYDGCATRAETERVSLADIEGGMMVRYDTTGLRAVDPRDATHLDVCLGDVVRAALRRVFICVVVMKSGLTVVGTSVPDSVAHFDPNSEVSPDNEVGRKLAYADAVHRLWLLMGFAERSTPGLRERYDIDHTGWWFGDESISPDNGDSRCEK